MKKILGLDLGVSSIGWALIKEENDRPKEILGMGVRVVPLDKDESDEFSSGNRITKNQKRTARRTMRKGYYRYVLRRVALTKELKKNGMFDEDLLPLPQQKLWELRAKAASKKVRLQELGRILYHLNQKRGYQHSRQETTEEKKEKEYVEAIMNRWRQLQEEGKTIGQKFYEELSENPHYRIKQQIFPREAYQAEFDRIMKTQKKFYPEVLTDEYIRHLRDDIIYLQRKLKSQKGLVSICEFEGFHVRDANGKEVFAGPKVAHRSNPLFQMDKIWETIHNISITNKKKEAYKLSAEQKQKLFDYLDHNEKLTRKQLFDLLGIKEKDGWYGNKMINKGIQGNLTKAALMEALQGHPKAGQLLQFSLEIKASGKKAYLYDRNTGEVTAEVEGLEVATGFEQQPLYALWHTIYSITDLQECRNALMKKFGLDEATADRLARIDFAKAGYGNKSVKAIRKILPYLMQGYKYHEAATLAGYRHAFVLTAEERATRPLPDQIPLLKKNALRQPVVEKILNQMIHVVNGIVDEQRGWVTKEEREKGHFEIRIELARELKQSQQERNETFKNLSRIERENREIEKELLSLGVRATRKNIIKYRLYHEISNSEKKIHAQCIYTGKTFSLSAALNGDNIDVDHIIPKTLLFDDSQSNKTLTFRKVNQEKGDRTAYDYMASKGEKALNEYVERVNQLYKNDIISKAKFNKLLTPANDIPQDFIQRQLRETQYISRKSREILGQVCRNVWVTSGSVTDYLRRLWGWEDILMNLQIGRIREFVADPLKEGITEIVTWETPDGKQQKKEAIKDWTKRDDHRHHAIDALVIACTKQGYIQRINTLSAKATRDELFKEVSKRKAEFRESLSLLDRYLILQQPFKPHVVAQKAAEILISFKAGKKVATWGKRFIRKGGKRQVVQRRVLVPRGPLSEESVYGKIKIIEKEKPVKYLFEHPDLIFKPYIKELVERRLAEHNGDVKSALNSLRNDPIYLDKKKKVPLVHGTCYKEEYVMKYPLESIKEKDLPYIIDAAVRELAGKRLSKFRGKEKEAFAEPLYLDKKKTIRIRSVRLLTGLSAVEPVHSDSEGNPIAFVKPGNNHHMAIYEDENGNKIPHLCTFWHAVERKKYGLPVIIHSPKEVWSQILSNPSSLPQAFLNKLPADNLNLVYSMQQNEMFLLGSEDYDHNRLSTYCYRLQKLAMSENGQINIWFRHAYETQLIDNKLASAAKRFYNVQSLGALERLNPVKIRVSRLGEIVETGIK